MLTLSSIASSTTRTGSISPAIACAARAPIRHPRIDRCATKCKKLSASEAPDPGRHHVGTPGDIISECPGDFVGIRSDRVGLVCDDKLHLTEPAGQAPILAHCGLPEGPHSGPASHILISMT